MLSKDLPGIAEQTKDPAVRAAALLCQKNQIYPVDSHVLSAEGEFIDGLWVEDALLFRASPRPPQIERPAPTYSGNSDSIYRQFLEAARDKARGGDR